MKKFYLVLGILEIMIAFLWVIGFIEPSVFTASIRTVSLGMNNIEKGLFGEGD